MKIWSAVLVACMSLASLHADAANRLSGGKSVGQQSGNVTHRETAGASGNPAQKAASPTAAAAPAPVAAAAPGRSWGGMLGGVAAGLGLAWLAHSMGLSEAFGQFIVVALLAFAVMVVVGVVLRARKSGRSEGLARHGGLALQSAGAGHASATDFPRSYNPSNVGNDASARPWERNNAAFESSRFGAEQGGGASMVGLAVPGSPSWGVPSDFDTAGFLTAAKTHFVSLQSAWDRSDIPSLRAMMTDAMLEEIKIQLADREAHRGAQQPNTTDVIVLEAQLLGIEDLGQGYMASVEFSGMIREELSAGPHTFREVWNMTKPKASGGWLVAGVQALQ